MVLLWFCWGFAFGLVRVWLGFCLSFVEEGCSKRPGRRAPLTNSFVVECVLLGLAGVLLGFGWGLAGFWVWFCWGLVVFLAVAWLGFGWRFLLGFGWWLAGVLAGVLLGFGKGFTGV